VVVDSNAVAVAAACAKQATKANLKILKIFLLAFLAKFRPSIILSFNHFDFTLIYAMK